MEPPRDAIDKLTRLHSDARLAWNGKDRNFALIQIYPHQARDEVYGEPWEGRGQIYGDSFDPITKIPMWLFSFTVEEVFNLAFLDKVKRWMRPLAERILENEREECQRRIDKIEAFSNDMGEYVAWHSNNVDTGRPPIVAKKFFTQEEKYAASNEGLAERREKKPLFDRGLPKEVRQKYEA